MAATTASPAAPATIERDAGPERRGIGDATSTWTLIGAEYIGRGPGTGDSGLEKEFPEPLAPSP